MSCEHTEDSFLKFPDKINPFRDVATGTGSGVSTCRPFFWNKKPKKDSGGGVASERIRVYPDQGSSYIFEGTTEEYMEAGALLVAVAQHEMNPDLVNVDDAFRTELVNVVKKQKVVIRAKDGPIVVLWKDAKKAGLIR